MGCDYYIEQYLQITLIQEENKNKEKEQDNNEFYILVSSIGGYITESDYDSDNEDWNTQWIYEKYLEVKKPPFILYKDGKFIYEQMCEKYEQLILDYFIQNGITNPIIKTIYKIEKRRLR